MAPASKTRKVLQCLQCCTSIYCWTLLPVKGKKKDVEEMMAKPNTGPFSAEMGGWNRLEPGWEALS